TEVHIFAFRVCLIGCVLYTFSTIAQAQSDLASTKQDADLPAVDSSSGSQAAGNGNGTGDGNGTGSSSGGTTVTKGGATPVTQSGSSCAKGPCPASTANTYVFPSKGKMNRYWLGNTVGPKALIGAGFTATWNTWVTNSPREWEKTGEGWSKRFGSSLLDNG